MSELLSESLHFVSLGLCSRGTDSGQRTPDEDVSQKLKGEARHNYTLATLGAEKVQESSTVLCGGKLQTLKFTYQRTEYAVFTQTESFLQLKHQVSMKDSPPSILRHEILYSSA